MDINAMITNPAVIGVIGMIITLVLGAVGFRKKIGGLVVAGVSKMIKSESIKNIVLEIIDEAAKSIDEAIPDKPKKP